MLKIAHAEEKNYSAKVVRLAGLRKHTNADRLQCVDIDFQTVITGLVAQEGDLYVFFPCGTKIDESFLSHTNSFRDKELNKNKEKVGFFEPKGVVSAIRLRGEKSMGYIVPVRDVEKWAEVPEGYLAGHVGYEFDTINGKEFTRKYVVKGSRQPGLGNQKKGKKPQLSRLVEQMINLHISTENLRRNAHKISPDDVISVTYKTHGTSFWCSNVLVKEEPTWWRNFLNKINFPVVNTKYDIVYGSRRVVKNSKFEDPKNNGHYYGYDLWKEICDHVKDRIPKNYTLYGECLGYLKDGSYVQKNYDYGCSKGQWKIQIYRITFTNPDGLVFELSTPQIREFCSKTGLEPVKLFYYGKAGDMYPELYNSVRAMLSSDPQHVDKWRENFIKALERDYNEKDCHLCIANKVPEEGIVVRREETSFQFEAYKLKSFAFLELSSKEEDAGISNIEDQTNEENEI